MKRFGWMSVVMLLIGAARVMAVDVQFTPQQQEAADKLRAKGAIITQLAADTDALSVNCSTAGKSVGDAEVAMLKGLPKIAQLNLATTSVSDAGLGNIAGLTSLTHLNLDRTSVTDAGLDHLKGLGELVYLNLYSTAVTDKGMSKLEGLKKLKKLYVWQTKVSAEGADGLKKVLPEVVINRGEELAAVAKVPAAQAGPVAINSICPVSGKPVDGEHTVTQDGKVIGFCCDKCPKQFEKDPKKFADKIKVDVKSDKPADDKKATDKKTDEKKADEKKPTEDKKADDKSEPKPAAANTTCPVSGEAVDPSQTFTYNGKTIAFCCEKCLAKFKKDPANFAGKVEEGK